MLASVKDNIAVHHQSQRQVPSPVRAGFVFTFCLLPPGSSLRDRQEMIPDSPGHGLDRQGHRVGDVFLLLPGDLHDGGVSHRKRI
jgi:hypothetical protein